MCLFSKIYILLFVGNLNEQFLLFNNHFFHKLNFIKKVDSSEYIYQVWNIKMSIQINILLEILLVQSLAKVCTHGLVVYQVS